MRILLIINIFIYFIAAIDRESSKTFDILNTIIHFITIFLCSEQFSLFSIVQFPNKECTSASSSTTNGTCYTTSEVQMDGMIQIQI